MSLSFSETQIYIQAQRARAKFDSQIGAKDPNLRLLVAHARLYDKLDDYAQELKTRRFRRPAAASRHSSLRNHENRSTIAGRGAYEEHGHTSFKNSMSAVTDCAPECALSEDDVTDVDMDTSDLIPEDQDSKGHGSRSKPHGSPTVIKATAAPNGDEAPSYTIAQSKTIISETPIDEAYDSDSDSDSSDSDSDSDSDLSPNFDIPVCLEGKTAIPVPVSRPHSPYHHIQLHSGMGPTLQFSDLPTDMPQDIEDLPALERSTATSRQTKQKTSQTAPIFELTSAKGIPLSPQLSDKTLGEVSAATSHADELPEALRHILSPYQTGKEAESANHTAIFRYLSTLVFWSRRKHATEVTDDVHDEKDHGII
ncbi:MAG: hypothetical protein L6R39_003007 [Caloplaca ligustica]|nr:MAG: hypothetical protein L6R39_003007 [Caloplaca ligustica]